MKPCEVFTRTLYPAIPLGVAIRDGGVVEMVKVGEPWMVSEAAVVLVIAPLVPVMPIKYVPGFVPDTAERVSGVTPLLVAPNVAETPAGMPLAFSATAPLKPLTLGVVTL